MSQGNRHCFFSRVIISADGQTERTADTQTVPSRLSHFFAFRPDPLELVRRGTLRGIAIVNSIRDGTYWASNSVSWLFLRVSSHARPSGCR